MARAWVFASALLLLFMANAAFGITPINVVPSQNYTIQADVNRSIAISFVVTGGTPPYKYYWYIQAPGQSFVVDSQCYYLSVCSYNATTTGAYDISLDVADSSGGRGGGGINMYVNPTLRADITPSNSKVSYGNSTYAELLPNGGAPPYTYVWSVTANRSGCPTPSFGDVQTAVFAPTAQDEGCSFILLGKIVDNVNESSFNESVVRVLGTQSGTSGHTNSSTKNTTGTSNTVSGNSLKNNSGSYSAEIVPVGNTTSQGVDILGLASGSAVVATVAGTSFDLSSQSASEGSAIILVDGQPYTLQSGIPYPLVAPSGYYIELIGTSATSTTTLASLHVYTAPQQNSTQAATNTTTVGTNHKYNGPTILQELFYVIVFLIFIGAIILAMFLLRRSQKPKPPIIAKPAGAA